MTLFKFLIFDQFNLIRIITSSFLEKKKNYVHNCQNNYKDYSISSENSISFFHQEKNWKIFLKINLTINKKKKRI